MYGENFQRVFTRGAKAAGVATPEALVRNAPPAIELRHSMEVATTMIYATCAQRGRQRRTEPFEISA